MGRGSLPIRQVGSWPRRVGGGGLVGGFFIVVVFARVCLWGGRGGIWQFDRSHVLGLILGCLDRSALSWTDSP